jgi:hypothetical protein
VGGPLGGQDDDDPGRAAPRDQVAGQGGELRPLGLGADGGGEVGVLVDDDEVDVLAAVAGDLARPAARSVVVAVVHELLEPLAAVDGVGDGRADELVGAVPPGAELDLLAVDQDELAVAGQRAVRGDEVQGVGLAAAGLAAEQHVALGQVDVNVLAVLVDAQVHRAEHGQREHRHGCRCGGGGHGGLLRGIWGRAGPGRDARGAACRMG